MKRGSKSLSNAITNGLPEFALGLLFAFEIYLFTTISTRPFMSFLALLDKLIK